MNRFYLPLSACLVVIAVCAVIAVAGRATPTQGKELSAGPLTPIGNGFTYQGYLTDGGSPAGGLYDFAFRLFPAQSGGTQVGTTITQTNRTVTGGLYTTSLDFGASAFQGDARWLEIAVRQTGVGNFTNLTPRQPLSPAPYAVYAGIAPWDGISGKPDSFNPPKPPFDLNTAASLAFGSSHAYTSITTDVDGLGLMSYYDSAFSGGGDLRIAHCVDVACTSSVARTLDSSGDVGLYTSIAVPGDGRALISYQDATNDDLRVAHCADIPCTSAITATLDTTGITGLYTSIAIGQDNLGIISYYDSSNTQLKVAHCSSSSCATATITAVDNGGDVGQYSSIALGNDGLALIAYYDATNTALKVAHCDDRPCTTATITTLDNAASVGQYISLAIGDNGMGLIAYFDATGLDLKMAHCSNIDCTAATISSPSLPFSSGRNNALAIGDDGLGIVSTQPSNDVVLIVHCSNTACSSATSNSLFASDSGGLEPSITIGQDGLPLISYFDNAGDDVIVMHCGSRACVNNQRRR
jgi:hypothetical protein